MEAYHATKVKNVGRHTIFLWRHPVHVYVLSSSGAHEAIKGTCAFKNGQTGETWHVLR